MKQAIWNDEVLAESDDIVTVEGNAYFPASSLKRQFFKPSDTHTQCVWKGTASYYDVEVKGAVNKDAAWFYPEPSQAAHKVKDRVAFWKGVTVKDV